jgi:glycosyltransferase involved in cell wall biosynthesis
VAHIIASLGIGGAERHLVNLLNALECDFRAVVFLGDKTPGPSFHADLDPLIEQRFLRIRRRSAPLGVLRLAALLREIRVDVVHTHMFESNLYGTVAARLAGVPVVVTTEHGENPWKGGLARWAERRVISPLADRRYCVSRRILELRRNVDGVPAGILRLINNGTVLPCLKKPQTKNAVPVIGTVGRFVPAKDYGRLLDAIAELRDRGRVLQCCLIGDGPEGDNLRGKVKSLQLDEIVQLPGFVNDVGRWYRSFDLYVSSSVREGLPLALLEAMAHGLPVVATDVGASAETVGHGIGGLVVRPGDTAALADALDKMLQSPELRAELGRNARTRIEDKYSARAVAEVHWHEYEQLLGSKHSARSKSAA